MRAGRRGGRSTAQATAAARRRRPSQGLARGRPRADCRGASVTVAERTRPLPLVPTPLAAVGLVIGGEMRSIHLKLEGFNPGGSVKDRTARGLIGDLDRRGLLAPEAVLIESTSGNLGVSLGRLARQRGLRFVAV